MIVAIVNNGAIEQTGDLYVLFPNVSFPASGPESEWMAENNLVPVTYFKAHDAATQKLVSCEAYLEGGDVFAVNVESLSADELTAKDEVVAASVRIQRDKLLAETDWRFRSDMNPSQDWIDYCQALRDIPAQDGFPNNVTWPTQPE